MRTGEKPQKAQKILENNATDNGIFLAKNNVEIV
jgi:hypothetical protein